jgi:hypothetical protein
MTLHDLAPMSAFSDLAAAGYRPAPMLPGADGAAGWTCADGRRVEFHEHFAAQALDNMPADAEALPGIVAGDGVLIVRAFRALRDMLPETPATWVAGDCRVAVYRAPDVRLSDLMEFGLVRSFGWRLPGARHHALARIAAKASAVLADKDRSAEDRTAAPDVIDRAEDRAAARDVLDRAERIGFRVPRPDCLFVLERDVAVEVPAGVTLPPADSLPVITEHDIAKAMESVGAYDGDAWPARAAEPHDPVAAWTCARNAKDRGGKVHGLALRDVLIPAECPPDPFAHVRAEAVEAHDQPQGQVATPQVQPAPTAPATDPYAGLYDCRGLVGDIVRHITDTAMSPIPLHALGAALTIVGTAAGRRYRGPTKSSCVLYVANVAESGAGKEHALESAKAILRAAGLGEHVGPGEYDSGSAYLKTLKRKPLCLSAIDEFGSVWEGMNNPKSTAWMGKMNRAWKTQWGKNFGTLDTSVSMTSDAVEIVAPHWSVIGASTPAQFWQALRGAKVEDGSLNRMLVLQADRVESASRIPSDLPVPDRIVTLLKAVYGSQVMPHRNDISDLGTLVDVPFAEGAESYWLTMESGFKAKAKDPVVGLFFKRSAEMSLRIATIRAIGINPLDPVVTVEDMEWGAWLVGLSAKAMVRNATDFIADTDHQAQLKDVRRIIKAAGGTIPRSVLVKKLDGKLKAFELDGVMKLLIEAGDVEEKMQAPADKGGRPGKAYALTATA